MSPSPLETTSSSSTSSASAHYHPPRKSGHLYKKTGLARSWKSRYFSLEGSVLYYFKREGDTVPKGIVVLTGCKIMATRDKKYYSFRISHPKTSKVYDLAATLHGRMEDWMEALRNAAHAQQLQQQTRSHSDSIAILEQTPAMSVSSFNVDEIDFQTIATDGDAEVADDYKDELESLMAEFVAQARDDAEGWKLQSEQRDCKVYVRSASRMGSCKSVGFINHHPYLVLKLLLDISRRESFDPQLLTTRRAFVYDDHTFIDQLTYKPVFPASARDFVHVTHWRVLQDGSILLIATSVKRDDICPPREPQVVRARTVMGGYLLTPNPEYTGAHVRYIVKADVKGGIPTALQTKVFIKQAFVTDGLRRALEDDEMFGLYGELPRVTNSTRFGLTTTEGDDYRETFTETSSVEQDQDESADESPVHAQHSVIPSEGLPAVPSKYRDLLDKAITRVDMVIDDETAWNFHSEKHGIKAYTKVDGSLTAAKGVGYLRYNPRAFVETVLNAELKKSYDSQLATGKRVASLDAQTHIDYLEYKPVFVVAGRDFCNLVHWRVLPGGTILVVSQSIEDLSPCPLKEPKVVRADLHVGCWRIVPDADYKGFHVTFMVKTDLKGSIPSRIVSKVAAEQPYIIHQLGLALKKRTDLDKFTSMGPMTNTIVDKTPAAAASKSVSFSTTTTQREATRSASLSKTTFTTPAQPEAEPAAAKGMPPASTPKKDELADVLATAKSDETSTTNFIVLNAVQFVVAILALKVVSLPGIFHYGVVGYLAVYFATMLYMGPCHMTPRRKLMIASFGPPDSGMILGTLNLDMTKTQKYIEEKRMKTGDHITVTHVILRALGDALGKTPSVNGHLVFGNYYPAPSVDISCLVAISGGKDLGVCRLPSCDKMTLKDIFNRVRGDATKLRSGKDKEQEDRNKIMTILPTWIIRLVVNIVGWLGGTLGLRIKPLGVEPYMFGSVMVTSVGMMGMELAFAPLTPYAQTPMLITIGAIKDTPVVEDGKIVVRPILTLTTTIDHRYVDGSQAARMAAWMKKCVEDPSLLEPVDA